MRVVGGISMVYASTVSSAHVAENKIIDLKFLDGTTLILLLNGPGNSPFLSLCESG